MFKETNIKLFKEHLQKINVLLSSYTPEIPEESNYFAVILEFRESDEILPIIKNHMYFLNHGSKIKWGLQIFHCNENERYIKKKLSSIPNIHYTNYGENSIKDREDYSNILKKKDFWQKVNGEKILIFQTDSLLIKFGIQEFIDYDYVGAPWSKPKDGVYVGNGGLSLRSKSKMINIIDKYSDDDNNLEDIFFSIHINEFGTSPNLEKAKTFSVEDIYYDDPIGIHVPNKIETKYLKQLLDKNLLNYV